VKRWKSSLVFDDNCLLSRNMFGALVRSLVFGILLFGDSDICKPEIIWSSQKTKYFHLESTAVHGM
jgi:hypothetical protein